MAPIGAVIGEWVGASAGLGYLMTQSLARGQTALAFAALVVLCLLGLALYHATDRAARRLRTLAIATRRMTMRILIRLIAALALREPSRCLPRRRTRSACCSTGSSTPTTPPW